MGDRGDDQPNAVPRIAAMGEAAGLKSARVLRQTPAAAKSARLNWQPNLCIMHTLLFGNRPYSSDQLRVPTCATMVRLSSLEADDPLRPLSPLQRGLSWRGSCELTGARVNEGLSP